MTGNRTPLYLTDRQYTELLKALTDAKTWRRERYTLHRQSLEIAAVAGIEREIWEQVITVKAG